MLTQNQIRYWELQEMKRANLAKEQELNRSNLAKEAETQRSNLASEELTYQKQNYDKYGSGLIPGIVRSIKAGTEDLTGVETSGRAGTAGILKAGGAIITSLPGFVNLMTSKPGNSNSSGKHAVYVSGTKPGDPAYTKYKEDLKKYGK